MAHSKRLTYLSERKHSHNRLMSDDFVASCWKRTIQHAKLRVICNFFFNHSQPLPHLRDCFTALTLLFHPASRCYRYRKSINQRTTRYTASDNKARWYQRKTPTHLWLVDTYAIWATANQAREVNRTLFIDETRLCEDKHYISRDYSHHFVEGFSTTFISSVISIAAGIFSKVPSVYGFWSLYWPA